MTVYQRTLIKQQQYFHRNYYRRLLTVSVVSAVISIVLLCAIVFVYLNRSQVTFYASNTAGFITPLKALDEPNRSVNYLLKPDPVEEVSIKELDVRK